MTYNYKRQFRIIKRALRQKGYLPKGWSGIHQILSFLVEKRLAFRRDVMIDTFHSIKFFPRATKEILKAIGRTPSLNFDNHHNQKKFNIYNFYKSYAWRRLRYDTLNKYGRRCMCCGFIGLDRQLHVDHIKPLRKYWHLRLDPDNVQVLCEDCNHGKGNRDQTDFRPSPDGFSSMYPADADFIYYPEKIQ